MAIACYLAMTAAEFSACTNLPAHIGWLACHFSPGGPGLSNIPKALPERSLLIIDDSTPLCQHQQELILRQLQDAVAALAVRAVILDFQRPSNPAVQELASFLQKSLPCSVVAPPQYVSGDSPVFLPPCPLDLPLDVHLAPYHGREIWLDAAPLPMQITITKEGSSYQTLTSHSSNDRWHWDPRLCCNYHISVHKDEIVFALNRDGQAFQFWLKKAEELGVTAAIGLYQEFKQ